MSQHQLDADKMLKFLAEHPIYDGAVKMIFGGFEDPRRSISYLNRMGWAKRDAAGTWTVTKSGRKRLES